MHREEILSEILKELKSYPQINFLAEGGAKAFNRYDELSDIDLMVDTDDGTAEATIMSFENLLNRLGGISTVYTVAEKKDHYHKFYKLYNTDKYSVIDIFMTEKSNTAKENEKYIHGEFEVHTDRYGYMKDQKFDLKKFEDKAEAFRKRSQAVFEFFQFQMEKEIIRDHFIDAMAYYMDLTLKPLIRLLRFKYNKAHYNFELRYLYDEFPENIVKEIEQLLSIKDMNALKEKQKMAIELYKREINDSFNF